MEMLNKLILASFASPEVLFTFVKCFASFSEAAENTFTLFYKLITKFLSISACKKKFNLMARDIIVIFTYLIFM